MCFVCKDNGSHFKVQAIQYCTFVSNVQAILNGYPLGLATFHSKGILLLKTSVLTLKNVS